MPPTYKRQRAPANEGASRAVKSDIEVLLRLCWAKVVPQSPKNEGLEIGKTILVAPTSATCRPAAPR